MELLFYRRKTDKKQNKYIMCSIVIIAIKKSKKKKKCNSNREWQNGMFGEDFSAKGKLIIWGSKPGTQHEEGYSRRRKQWMPGGGGTMPCMLEEKQVGQGGWIEQWREMRSEQKDIRSCRIWMPMWELWILFCMTWEASGILIQRRYKLAKF